ncbi:hypothetical protein AMTR_s00117p00129740 [Amborella trichopoda]|uniref:Uncharacterized protein n=1 Tax=Amborella trichopoda TaxID=13333 RepID=W1NTQ7_AMBTC|nr:hypothetical protein AMTR_s00117p00129740 [Amborella trichopoda]
MANAILASVNAKFFPMQILGPYPNGKKAKGCLAAFDTPSENLSGRNSSASSPQISRSWWIMSIGRTRWTPAGKSRPPKFTLL